MKKKKKVKNKNKKVKLFYNKFNFYFKFNFKLFHNNINKNYFLLKNKNKLIYKMKKELGIGDWGLGIGDWGLGPIPNPHNIKLPFKNNILNH